MLSLKEASNQIFADAVPLSVCEDWKIFLDWVWHSGDYGCVICQHYTHYDGVCDYERCNEFFDSSAGVDATASGSGRGADPSAAGSGPSYDRPGDDSGWWEAVTFGVT